ncbi:hypothetical protein BC827DRAFT_1236685 [Russula dissimulans]|nr:hypothetical protein BC827DRAFT_1236685 [Russula dissimulans]
MPTSRSTSTTLPKTDSPQVQQMADEDPNYLSAYHICLQYETKLELAADENKLRHLRILAFLLLNAPHRGVRSEVARSIHSRKDDRDLVSFGALLERYLLLPLMKHRSRTPVPSEHWSRSPSPLGVVEDQVQVDITEAPKNHKDAKDRALIRDNWRCIVTDVVQWGAPDDIMDQLDVKQTIIAICTECAHIAPEATFFGMHPELDKNENSKRDHFSFVSAVLKQFLYDIDNFIGEKVHSLTNVITMQADIHNVFDELEFYFERTPQRNRYETKYLTPYGLKPYPNIRQFVTFSTIDPEHLPVPSPELLAFHATCCKVAHFSGAADYINKIFHAAQRMGELADDITSAEMLGYALSSLANGTVTVRHDK